MKAWRIETIAAPRLWLRALKARCAGRGSLAKHGGTLVIQPLPGIGDMVWHLPHIHAIAAASGAGVTLLTKRRSGADRLFVADPAVNDILWLDRNPGAHDGFVGLLRLVLDLRAGRFRQVWILHESARYAVACVLAGIPQRIGYGRGFQRHLVTNRVRLPEGEIWNHAMTKADKLIESFGLPRAEPEPRLVVSTAAERVVLDCYAHLPKPWIAIGIGTSEPVKQWGGENFTELAVALNRLRPMTLFVIGGEAERDLACSIIERAAQMNVTVKNITSFPLDQVAALIAQCDLYVGNDTGLLNIAAALGVKAVGLFGGSRPVTHSQHIAIMLPADRAQGMSGITVNGVIQRVYSQVVSLR